MTPTERKILERIRDRGGRLLVLQLTANGGSTGKALGQLLMQDLVEIVDDPSGVIDRSGKPAAALAITEHGRRMLEVER